ncbi:MAG: DNA photolyase, partial [Pseudomonadota bacterium]
KTYLARATNITKYTEGRFGGIHGLATEAPALPGPPHPERQPLPEPEAWMPEGRVALLLTEDDLSPSWLLEGGLAPSSIACLLSAHGRSPLEVAQSVMDFTKGAAEDALARYGDRCGGAGPITQEPREVVDWATALGVSQVVSPLAPVGPGAKAQRRLRDALADAGIDLVRPIRPYDAAAWPYATAGFFKFKEKIPTLVGQMKGLRAA